MEWYGYNSKMNHRPVKLKRYDTFQQFVNENYGVAANEV